MTHRLAIGLQSLDLITPQAETRSLDALEHIYRDVLRRSHDLPAAGPVRNVHYRS